MSIGKLNEGPLHSELKKLYVLENGKTEVSIGNFIVDVLSDGVIYEIQTGSFSGLTKKLSYLLERNIVVLVHPIAKNTFISKHKNSFSEQSINLRRSNKHGDFIHIVNELIYLPQLMKHPRFSVEVILTEEKQNRVYDPTLRRKRGGWRTISRELISIIDRRKINNMSELFKFTNNKIPDTFNSKELSIAINQPIDIARKMAYCLYKAGITEIIGKVGNAKQYTRVV